MPNTPGNTTSFIPKQGPAKRSTQTATRQIHLFAVISYLVFASSLLAAVGVFLYERHVEKQLEAKVSELSGEINGFSDADMERVREFNNRLDQVRKQLDKSVSIVSVFDALERATVESATLEELSLKRASDDSIDLAVKVSTNNFDSSLFQRGVFERNDVISSVAIESLDLIKDSDEGSSLSGVAFVAKLTVPTEAIRITAEEVVEALPPIEAIPDATAVPTSTVADLIPLGATTSITTTEETINQNEI
jgi:hypothetical protein